MTALVTGWPRYSSAACFSFCRIIAEISGGGYSLPPAFTRTSPLPARTTEYGTIFISSETSANLRPMKRLIENTVFSGLVTAWRLATWPDQALARFGEAHHRGGDAAAFGIRNDDRFATFHDRHDGVGRPEIDSNDLAHVLSPSHPALRGRPASAPDPRARPQR